VLLAALTGLSVVAQQPLPPELLGSGGFNLAGNPTDMSGEWVPRFHEDADERGGGPELGDYTGLPINDAGRARADAWTPSWLSMPEWQCRPHPVDYIWRGPSQMRIWKEIDPITRELAMFHQYWLRSTDRPIYMDGRPRPDPDAPHTWGGFSKGEWDGDQLRIVTTHMKEGYLRRNGAPRSPKATLVQHWIRHGGVLTGVMMIYDPVYLDDVHVRSSDYVLDPTQHITPYPCEPKEEEVDRAFGEVPHYLPGANTQLFEWADKFGIPHAAVRGGAATRYPEYRAAVDAMLADKGPVLKTPEYPDSPREAARPMPAPDLASPPGVRVIPVRDNVYVLAGAGGNVTASVGADGVFLVDAGSAASAPQLLAALQQLTRRPIMYIFNTSVDADHVGGTEALSKAGAALRNTGGNALGNRDADDALILSHENVLTRMSKAQPQPPFAAWPKDVFYGSEWTLFRWFNGEGVRFTHGPAAHTDGDSFVHFRRTDVIAAGDLYVNDRYPVIDVEKGGGINGLIAAANRLLQLAASDFMAEGGTIIVPGHGRVSDSADLAYYRDMLTIVRDRVDALKRQGMTLQQVQAARPTRDYDAEFGVTSGPWTTDMFVEAVYRGVGAVAPATR
jgi:cyclase